MKTLGVLIMVLAVAIAVVPLFFNCLHDGKAITLASGAKIPMKCYWTAMAAIATAVPLFGVGLLQTFSGRKETRRPLGTIGGLLGAVAIALPTVLIGVCNHPDASCNLVMRPALIFLGVLAIGLSLTTVMLPGPRAEQPA